MGKKYDAGGPDTHEGGLSLWRANRREMPERIRYLQERMNEEEAHNLGELAKIIFSKYSPIFLDKENNLWKLAELPVRPDEEEHADEQEV